MNQFGKTSRLEITAARSKSGMTFIEDSFFTAPFKIMKPFESEDGGITVFQQVSSAGILAGDIQEHNFTVKKKAKLEIVSQSFEKIFKMNEGEIAERKINATVEENASLIFAPLPCIPFLQSNFSSRTKIFLKDKSSRLIYEDILCGGRIAHGEIFEYKTYHNLIEIYREGQLIFRDNAFFEGSNGGKNPKAKELLQSPSMFGKFTHTGTLLLFGYEKSVPEIRNLLNLEEKLLYTEESISYNPQKQVLVEVSETDSGDIVVRAQGYSAEDIQILFTNLKTIQQNLFI